MINSKLPIGDDIHVPGTMNDAAVAVQINKKFLAISITQIAGVHFEEKLSLKESAIRMARCGLAELAASGAHAKGYLLALNFPTALPEEDLEEFYEGLEQVQQEFNFNLLAITVHITTGPLSGNLTVLGFFEHPDFSHYEHAQSGDRLYMVDTLGDAELGYQIAHHQKFKELKEAERNFLLNAYRYPQPQIHIGKNLLGRIHGAFNIVNGIIHDVTMLAKKSNLNAFIKLSQIPLSSAAQTILDQLPPSGHQEFWKTILNGKNDYRLLISVPSNEVEWIEAFALSHQIKLTHLGHLGLQHELNPSGWISILDHNNNPLIFQESGSVDAS